MKTLRTLKYFVAGVAAVTLASFAAMPQASAAAMANSKHDLSNTSTTGIYSGADTDGTNQICVFCHTPHNANTAVGPLWNRAAGTDGVTMYDATNLRGTIDTGGLNKESSICLSCHDGTIAFDAFANKPGTGTGTTTFTFTGTSDSKMSGATNTAAKVDGNLSNDHPVSIDYVADSSMVVDPTTNGVVLFADGATDYVECASCHDPHGTGTNDMFLRASLTGSEICVACHIK